MHVQFPEPKQGQYLNRGPCFLNRILLGVPGGARESLSEVLVVQGRNEEINCRIMLQKHEAMSSTNFSFNVAMVPKQIGFPKFVESTVNHTSYSRVCIHMAANSCQSNLAYTIYTPQQFINMNR